MTRVAKKTAIDNPTRVPIDARVSEQIPQQVPLFDMSVALIRRSKSVKNGSLFRYTPDLHEIERVSENGEIEEKRGETRHSLKRLFLWLEHHTAA